MKKVPPVKKVKAEAPVAPTFPEPHEDYTKKQAAWLQYAKGWLFFLIVVAAFYFGFIYIRFTLPEMSGVQVIGFSFCLAFMWVEVLQWGVTKPFNCLKCMNGWLALILAFLFHAQLWPLYLPVGLFTGAIFSAIKSRWL